MLKNARHEGFAAALAADASLEEACTAAGLRYDRGNASRLRKREDVVARVEELREASESALTPPADPAAMALTFFKAAAAAASKNQHGPMVRALEMAGKIMGSFDGPQTKGDVPSLEQILAKAAQYGSPVVFAFKLAMRAHGFDRPPDEEIDDAAHALAAYFHGPGQLARLADALLERAG